MSRIKTIHVFNVYSTISQSTIINSPIGFNIALTNVDARLKQRFINVVPTLCNVVSMLFQRRTLTLYQRCATLKILRRILFHFERRINIISTLIHNVETRLIQRWNVGWARADKVLRFFFYTPITMISPKIFKTELSKDFPSTQL